jgi:hypothetical protein
VCDIVTHRVECVTLRHTEWSVRYCDTQSRVCDIVTHRVECVTHRVECAILRHTEWSVQHCDTQSGVCENVYASGDNTLSMEVETKPLLSDSVELTLPGGFKLATPKSLA